MSPFLYLDILRTSSLCCPTFVLPCSPHCSHGSPYPSSHLPMQEYFCKHPQILEPLRSQCACTLTNYFVLCCRYGCQGSLTLKKFTDIAKATCWYCLCQKTPEKRFFVSERASLCLGCGPRLAAKWSDNYWLRASFLKASFFRAMPKIKLEITKNFFDMMVAKIALCASVESRNKFSIIPEPLLTAHFNNCHLLISGDNVHWEIGMWIPIILFAPSRIALEHLQFKGPEKTDSLSMTKVLVPSMYSRFDA